MGRVRWNTCLPVKTLRIVLLLLLLVGTAAIRCWDAGNVFIGDFVFFSDPDCYSRMTRVKEIVAHPGTVIGRHDFENWPEGVEPHTTAPMDYVLATGVAVFRPFVETTARALDLAGAWVPVVLSLAAAGFLWRWTRDAAWNGSRWVVMAFFAISPMLVHGNILGRPDHQALLIPLLTMALGAEVALLAGWESRQRWALLSGAAWGAALWVSLYEPTILFAATLLLVAMLHPRSLISRERLAGWAILAGVVVIALLVDGWTSPVPSDEVRAAFPNWSQTIGELRSVPLWSPMMLTWTATTLPLAFLLLALTAYRQREKARPALYLLAMLALLIGLTAWQLRWAYFLGLIFALSLPWQLAILRRRSVVAAFLAIGSVMILVGWKQQWIAPSVETQAQSLQRKQRNVSLRHIAHLIMQQEEQGAIIAPWWSSPALVYWTGQPAVAGSSHQSLPGTLDVSRFYLAPDPQEALAIAKKRQVTFIVADDPEQQIPNACTILGRSLPEESDTMIGRLYRRPNSPPPGFTYLGGNLLYRLFRVQPAE